MYKLKKDDELHSVWTYNGLVYAKVDENDEPTQVRHMLDIDDLFEGSFYEADGGDDGENNTNTGELDSTNNTPPEESNSITPNSRFSVVTPVIKTRSKARRLSAISEEVTAKTPIEPIKIRKINV